jgi:hypothetical protein
MILISLHLPHYKLLIIYHQKELLVLSKEAINPLPKSSVEGKQHKRKSQKSEIFSGMPYKQTADSKEKEKTSKIKGKAE